MLGLLAGEVEQGADPMVVAVQLRAGVVEHEGEDELLHEAEYGQIFVAANLVEDSPLRFAQESDAVGAGEGFREEAAAEVELCAFGENVLDLPGRFGRAGEDVPEVEIMEHGHPFQVAPLRRASRPGRAAASRGPSSRR